MLPGSHVALVARAECVMLDKRPFIHDGIAALETLLERMADHRHKKTPELRPLLSWPAPWRPLRADINPDILLARCIGGPFSRPDRGYATRADP